MTSKTRWFAAALLALAPQAPAAAQDYPSKTVTIVVSLAAGSGMDAITRLYAEKLSQALGKPVIVENKPGAVGRDGQGTRPGRLAVTRRC